MMRVAMSKRFIAEECEPKGFEVKILRSDNGGEYIAEEFGIYCRSKKIGREYSPPHGQSADGVSENYWKEVARPVRAVLWDQQCDDDWWPESTRRSSSSCSKLPWARL
jgi:hypothetical protein